MAIYFAFVGKPRAITQQWTGLEKQCPIYRKI